MSCTIDWDRTMFKLLNGCAISSIQTLPMISLLKIGNKHGTWWQRGSLPISPHMKFQFDFDRILLIYNVLSTRKNHHLA